MTYEGSAHNPYLHADGVRRDMPCDPHFCLYCEDSGHVEDWGTSPMWEVVESAIVKMVVLIMILLPFYLVWEALR